MTFQTEQLPVSGGLKMEVRRFSGGDRSPVICIPGLTRNAADFDDLAPQLAATGRDVMTVSLRGRGDSDHDPEYVNYHPATYRDDILAVLDHFDLSEAIFVGTSLGGIVTMLTHETAPGRIKAAVLNDVGPELAPEGIMRIAGYVGASKGPAATIEEAMARIKAINGVAFPDASDNEWRVFAHRTFRQRDDGQWALNYDPNIARAMMENPLPTDLWPGFTSLKGKPTLLFRGAISDLLSVEIVDKMRAVYPDFDYCEVPRIGHAPMMTEPAAFDALTSFLERID